MARPFVYMNMAMTADGKITSASREYPTFTSRTDKKTMDRLRAEADAVLIGAGTLRADDPPLHVRDPEMRAYRKALGKPDGLLHVVVSGSASIDPDARFFAADARAERVLVVVGKDAESGRVEALRGRAEVWEIGNGGVDLGELLRRLRARGIERLLVEGGGEMNWAFAREGLLDELYVTVAPCLLGGRNAPTLLEGDGFPMERRLRLRLVEARPVEGEIFCRYAVDR